jgi:lysophospholipase L1-like esterase
MPNRSLNALVILMAVICVAEHGVADRNVRITFFGDSLTSCSGVSSDFKSGFLSYRQALWRMAMQDEWSRCVDVVGGRSGCNRKLDTFLNSSKSFPQSHDAFFGRTLASAVQDVASVAAHRPHIVVACLGVNDLMANAKSSVLQQLYGKLISRITKAGADLLLLNLPAFDASHRKKRVRVLAQGVDAANRAIGASVSEASTTLLTRRGSSRTVSLVDIHSGYNSTSMSYDGIHPNTAGEEHIAAAVERHLKPMLSKHGCG